MAIELPKDAGGRDIPSGTEVPYGADGDRGAVSVTGYGRYAPGTFPKPPDSRGKPQAVGVCGDPPEPGGPVRAHARDTGEKRAEREPHAGDCAVDDDPAAGRHAGIECPYCGGQVDSHAGRIDDGRVLVCVKGRPPMREARYRCGHCGSTVVFLERCEPGGGRR